MPTTDRRVLEGTTMTLWAEFRNRSNVLTNPDAVTFRAEYPGGVIEKTWPTPDGSLFANPSAGLFEMDVSTTGRVGRWILRATGSGDAEAPAESYFDVIASDLRSR